MIRKIIKLRGAGILLAIALCLFSTAQANAGIFDWFSRSYSVENTRETDVNIRAYSGSDLQLNGIRINDPRPLANFSILWEGSYFVSQNKPVLISEGLGAQLESASESVLRELTVVATAYSSTPDQTDDTPFITAMGTFVRDGIVAANFLPLGTKIKIPELYGDKIFVVEDRMNKRFDYRLDVWFPDRQGALNFGIKNVRVKILES